MGTNPQIVLIFGEFDEFIFDMPATSIVGVYFFPSTEVDFVAAEDDMELIQMMASLGLPTTFGTRSEVTLCSLSL